MWKYITVNSCMHHHSSLLKWSTKQVICVGGMAGIEPTLSKSNNWTLLLPCQLSQGGCLAVCKYMEVYGSICISEKLFKQYIEVHTSTSVYLFWLPGLFPAAPCLPGWLTSKLQQICSCHKTLVLVQAETSLYNCSSSSSSLLESCLPVQWTIAVAAAATSWKAAKSLLLQLQRQRLWQNHVWNCTMPIVYVDLQNKSKTLNQ